MCRKMQKASLSALLLCCHPRLHPNRAFPDVAGRVAMEVIEIFPSAISWHVLSFSYVASGGKTNLVQKDETNMYTELIHQSLIAQVVMIPFTKR